MSRKDDAGKLDMTLLTDSMGPALRGVTEVLQWAITNKKPTPYLRDSWMTVPDGERRYKAALVRHLLEGTVRDAESGLLHAQHVATNALMYLHFTLQGANQTPSTLVYPPIDGVVYPRYGDYNPC